MVDAMFHPLAIYVVALGVGFLLPLLFRRSQGLASLVFLAALAFMTAVAGIGLLSLSGGAATIAIETAGIAPPFAINLRFGVYEALFVFAVNLAALLAAWHYLPRLRQQAATLLLFIIMVMGIDGMVMTRDLFNLFIFIEITSIATYALIGFERSASVLAAGFKYIIATAIASAFFLLGTAFIYYQTGTLNIDDIIAHQALIGGPIGFVALVLLLTSLLIELKPYPANGWGLDVYETAPTGIASVISVGVSAGVLFALLKLLPLFAPFVTTIMVVGGGTFLVSNLIGLKQTSARRLLGYSSIGQMGLLTFAVAAVYQLDAVQQLPLIVGGLFINHLLAKAALFWLAGIVGREQLQEWSAIAGKPVLLVVFAACLAALIGLPPFPGFWAKWELVLQLAAGGGYAWIALILVGSLLEAAYLFRWFGHAQRADGQAQVSLSASQLLPSVIAVLALTAAGYLAAQTAHTAGIKPWLPLYAGVVLALFEGLPGRIKGMLAIVTIAAGGGWLAADLAGLNRDLWGHPHWRRCAHDGCLAVSAPRPPRLLRTAQHPAVVTGDAVTRRHQS